MMVTVKALSNFEHDTKRIKNSEFSVSERTAEKLAAKGLVKILKPVPQQPVGKKSSASPAGQALPEKTVKKSKRGRPQQQSEEESSSPTPLFD